jgi:dolichol-phosphate mannosyltransferase
MKDSASLGADGAAMTPVMPQLSIVVPTFNEADNVLPLIDKLEAALEGHTWEAVFVDDNSIDGTAALVNRIGATKPYIRCIHRVGRRGLASAVIEGALSCASPNIAVMDADLQHDERILPKMLTKLTQGDLDLVVGSRYVGGGGVGEWSRLRLGMSRLATQLSRLIVSEALQDPMSGFFMIRRSAFMTAVQNLSGTGYKILLDLLSSAPTPLRFAEVPYEFRPRVHGDSKLSAKVLLDYVVMIAQKKAGSWTRRVRA